MINKKTTLLFLVCFSVSMHASDNSMWRLVGNVLSSFQEKIQFNQMVLPNWQGFYMPTALEVDQQGQQEYSVNNRLSYWLVKKSLWHSAVPRGLDAVAWYAFLTVPDLMRGKRQAALQKFKEGLVTDVIVTSASLAVPQLGGALSSRLHPILPISLDLIARVAVCSYVVRKYILIPEKEEKVTFEQQIEALNLAISRYEKNLAPEELSTVRENREKPVKYLRELETLANSEKRIGIFGAKAYGLKPISYKSAIEHGVKTGHISPSGRPYCVCTPEKTKAERFFGALIAHHGQNSSND